MSSFKYYKSDFAVIVNIGASYTDNSGQVRALETDVPFKFRFYTPLTGDADNSYEASSNGTELKNCSILNSHQVLVYINLCQHEFALGDLMLEAEFIVDDVHYEGDDECNIMRLYNTGIKITDQPDLDTEGQMTVDIYDVLLDEAVRMKAARAAEAALTPKINEVDQLITGVSAAEAIRVSSENTRVSNEVTRQQNETTRMQHETTRENNETVRKSSEAIRNGNEDTRTSNENSRVAAEAERVNAESTRANAETERGVAESSRVQAESDRATAEISRSDSENIRAANENARIANETSRSNAEADRVVAENNRVLSEANRVFAESSRQASENERISSEAARIAAETTRNTEESARVAAEIARETAENTRSANEQNRENEYNDLIDRFKNIEVVNYDIRIHALEVSSLSLGTIVGEEDEIDDSVWSTE